MVGKPNFLLAIVMAFLLGAGVKSTTAADQTEGLFVSEVRPERIQGEYHGPNGCIQFSSEVRGGDRSLVVTTAEGEPILIVRKPERASMMTVKVGQTKLLVQMNQPGGGLPRYSDYVVPQAFHNLVDSALSQNFLIRALIQQLDRQSANETRRRAVEHLAMSSEADSIIEGAKALGNAGVMGTDNPAALQFYAFTMRLAKIKDMMQRGAAATRDGTLPSHHSFHRMHLMYAYTEQETCPECTTGSCPYMGDPQSSDCHGMCGRQCSCWWWVCGDCCVHQGCLDHDDCCVRDGYFSYSCTIGLFLGGFSCSGYTC